MAISYLVNNGYFILERNYQIKSGEIDIIARKDSIIVAIEVKYRSSEKYGAPSMAVTKTKQRHISQTFSHFIYTHRLPFDSAYRFDVIGIKKNGEIEHIENAFDYMGES